MFFKKWREERRKKEIGKILDGGVIVLEEVILKHPLTEKIGEEFSLVYLGGENLVKHSKTLTWLTIALFVSSIFMIVLSIGQLVVFLWLTGLGFW